MEKCYFYLTCRLQPETTDNYEHLENVIFSKLMLAKKRSGNYHIQCMKNHIEKPW